MEYLLLLIIINPYGLSSEQIKFQGPEARVKCENFKKTMEEKSSKDLVRIRTDISYKAECIKIN